QPATQTPARGTTNAAAPNVVNITNMRFGAGTVTVKAGSTVTWQQSDDMPHTVSGEGWGSGTLNRGERFSHTFDKPGRYTYTCRFHPHMSAVVIVE
ncbi:MAG: plastocyanin/azurin family copper-binding protein, partial [Gammaproteobacteria bacterium]